MNIRQKKNLLSGIRPTGKIHLGNYFGALKNWVSLQENYKCFFMVADIHALTTSQNVAGLKEDSLNLVMELLSIGINPANSVLFIQSAVPAHSELFTLLSMITPVGWLERCPTFKEQKQQLGDSATSSYGFLGYPVLQAADIILYDSEKVPVGIDQVPHLELAREIARRFNYIFKKDILKEPQPLITSVPKLPGLDGRKMSKSYDNCIYLTDSESGVKTKVFSMFTDPKKMRADDPGHFEGCVAHKFLKVFSDENIKKIEEECSAGKRGCVVCKKELMAKVNDFLKPIQEKINYYKSNEAEVKAIIKNGNLAAGNYASNKLNQIKETVNFYK